MGHGGSELFLFENETGIRFPPPQAQCYGSQKQKTRSDHDRAAVSEKRMSRFWPKRRKESKGKMPGQSERLELVGAQLKGVLEGFKFRGRYPNRVTFEFDGFACKENMAGEPNAFYMAEGGSMIAEFEFDCGLGYFQFVRWRAKRLRPEDRA